MSENSPRASVPGLRNVVDDLCRSNAALVKARRTQGGRHRLPSRKALVGVVEGLRAAFFPAYFGSSALSEEAIPFYVGATLDTALFALGEQVRRALEYACERDPDECPECPRRAALATEAFAQRLPQVREWLASDVQAAYENDPAATSPDEALFCYPGVTAITFHRLAHELYRLHVPLIARMVAEHAHTITGIDIHPGAQIGPSFFIDHGTGVVIGETARVGQRVCLYQGVTLGAKSFPLDEHGLPIKGRDRHPILEDEVVIYAGATLLGRIVIGKGSQIGGNVWLTRSVPPGSRITQGNIRTEAFEGGAGI